MFFGVNFALCSVEILIKFCDYENIVSQIQAAVGQAYYSTPFAYPNPGDFDAVLERIGDLCKKDGKKYIYAYCNEPDYTMHRKGCFGKDSVEVIQSLEKNPILELYTNPPVEKVSIV